MIDFQPIDLTRREEYLDLLSAGADRGCEYSFANLYLWGRQKAAVLNGFLVLFSQFSRQSVYPFPVGRGDIRPVLDAVIADARERGIACRITGLTRSGCELLEALYPRRFRFHTDRDGFDYVYEIDALADLKGRKYQKKRNHLHRFQEEHPQAQVRPLGEDTLPAMREMAAQWYADRGREDPHGDYHMERAALRKAFRDYRALEMEGLALYDGDRILAMTMGSRLSPDTFDIHFEKALSTEDGAYAAINQAFAQYLREKYPELRYLNREDDMGLEGLRKAKLSYAPARFLEKWWAALVEEEHEY